MIITAKTLKTIVSKLGKRTKELEELNGKLQNPITIDDVKELTEFYTQQARRIKTREMTLDQCYAPLSVVLRAWWGKTAKAYKYRKQFVSAHLSKDSPLDDFRLQIFRDEAPAGATVERLNVSVKYDDRIKENSFNIIEKLLREGK